MTPEDDAYVTEWFVAVERLATAACRDADEIRLLQLANRLPLPSYVRSDGAQMVPRDLLDLAQEAGGFDELPAWFAEQWESPVDAVLEWDGYLSGHYVCLRSCRPENMRRKEELVRSISAQLERPAPEDDDWLVRLHALIDELDALELPFAPYDRLRLGGPVSRDRLITAPRRDFPAPWSRAARRRRG
jgi:Family of unknown function (DUF6058)